jgi:hypothetical protein
MKDDLFEAYQPNVSELLKAKLPFGEHHKQACAMTAGVEMVNIRS